MIGYGKYLSKIALGVIGHIRGKIIAFLTSKKSNSLKREEMIMNRIAAPLIIILIGQILTSGGCGTVSRMANSGGTLYVVEVIAGEGDGSANVERSIKIMKSRLNAVGFDGDVKASDSGGNCIEVKLYGKQEPELIEKFLFKSYKLELIKVVSPPSPSPFKTFAKKEEAETAAGEEQQVLPYPEREDRTASQFVIVEKQPIVTGEDIRDAQAVSRTGSHADYQISFTLKPEGAVKFGEWTERNINNYLGVVLDGKVQSIAFIKTKISDMGEISGRFSKAEAEAIALSLKSGYMPWELKVIERRTF